MHRFYLPPADWAGSALRLADAEAHHALHVMRVRTGDELVVLDGAGHAAVCEVTATDRHHVALAVRRRHDQPPLPFRLTLLQAITKTKSMDLIVQKATELGAARIVPLLSDRSVPRLDPGEAARRVDKWRAVAIEAIKQSGAAWLPQIDTPTTPAAFLATAPPFPVSLLASLQPGARHPRACLNSARTEGRPPPGEVAVWVGPEGDFTPEELDRIQASGAFPITLGPLVLRSETAALYCLAVLGYELQAR